MAKQHANGAGERRQVLRDLAFTAESGEIIALLGPSGIGKTTLLRIILRLDHDFIGHLSGPPDPVGTIFQEPRLLPWLTVADNLRLVGSGDAAAALREVELPGVGNMMPSELSLGMARRVAIARALMISPRTIIADEPFASLDRSLAKTIGARLAERGRTCGTLILFSTHEIDLALAIATRVLVLSGSPATLAADMILPVHDQAAREERRDQLTDRFAFLTAPQAGMPEETDETLV